MFWLSTLNYWLAVGGLLLLAETVFLYIDYFYLNSRYYTKWVHPYVWFMIIPTTVGTVALSLLYSEYFGFIPCSLCWLQRIAIYPQALLAIVAYKTKDHVFFPLYGIALSLFGLVVAVYHYIYQMQPKEVATSLLMPCLADGSGDCATKVIEEFGFVTFPLLSAITFAFLIVLFYLIRQQ